MKFRFVISEQGAQLVVLKEEGDKRYRASEWTADPESTFLYHVKKALNKHGFDLIKKRMWRDGHMVDDLQQYLRTRSRRSETPHIYIHNPKWAIQSATFYLEELGSADLLITLDIYEEQQDCSQRLARLASKLPASLLDAIVLTGELAGKEKELLGNDD